jgi:hypothetical protein
MGKRTIASAKLERKPNFPYDAMPVGHGLEQKGFRPLQAALMREDWSESFLVESWTAPNG